MSGYLSVRVPTIMQVAFGAALGMLMTLGLLLLASLVLTAGLTAVGNRIGSWIGADASGALVGVLDAVVSTAAVLESLARVITSVSTESTPFMA